MTSIIITLENGESIQITKHEVHWFSRLNNLLGQCTMDDLLDFCRERLADVRHDESVDLFDPPDLSDPSDPSEQ